MSSSPLDALAARFDLCAAAQTKLTQLAELLARDPSAPTAIRDRERVIEDHLADSFVALELEALKTARAVVDIGSGAGLPGLALAAALPNTEFTLLESVGRKCAFLERAVAHCGFDNVDVVNTRAESWVAGLGRFDVATARALAPLPVVAEYAAPMLASGGQLIDWRGRLDTADELRARRAAATLNLQMLDPLRVEPYGGAHNRYLYVMSKLSDTPSRFPRRPGVAAKRPLGRDAADPNVRVDPEMLPEPDSI
jgi:16S rRNA (guanine527-N7)-methyltransferase